MAEIADQAENNVLNNFKRLAADFGRINRNFNRVKDLLQAHKRWLRGVSGEVANGRITKQSFAESFTKILGQDFSLLMELEKYYSALEKEAERIKLAAQLQAQQSPRSLAAVDISFEILLTSEEQRAEGAKRTIAAIAQQLRALEQRAIATAGMAAWQNAIEQGFDDAYNSLDRLQFLIQRDMRRILAFYKQQVKEYVSEKQIIGTTAAYQHVSVEIFTNDVGLQKVLNQYPTDILSRGWLCVYWRNEPFPKMRRIPEAYDAYAPVKFYHGKLANPAPPMTHYIVIQVSMGFDHVNRLACIQIYIAMPEVVYKAAAANGFGGVEWLLHAVLPPPLFNYLEKEAAVRYAPAPEWGTQGKTIFTSPRTYVERVM